AEAAAAAAADALAAQQSVAAAAQSAAVAAQEAARASAAAARTAQLNAQAQQDAALAAQYAAEAANEAAAAVAAADEAERDAAAARQAAQQAEDAAAAARAAADQAERDAAAAEEAAQHALADAQQAQDAAALAQENADAQARAALGTSSPTGEAGVQALPRVNAEVVSRTVIQCPPLTDSDYCEFTVTYRITGSIDYVLVTCPDFNDLYCPGEQITDHLKSQPVDMTHEQLVQLTREDINDLLKRLATSLISDYVDCAKGLGILDGKAGETPDNWGVSCAWVAADLVLPAVAAVIARSIKALRIAMRTGDGIVEAYTALKATEISAGTLAKIGDDVYRTVLNFCLGHSFAADTPVLMADHSFKPIGEVVPGDAVLAFDPASGQSVAGTVTRQFVNKDTRLTDVTVRGDNGDLAVLNTTPTHPFWVEGTVSGWVAAQDLDPGDPLRTADGQRATVVSERTFDGAQTMYDLTVEDAHTYYVGVGDAGVLVHNATCPTWVYNALSALRTKALTSGRLFAPNGTELYTEIRSGTDASTSAIDTYLKTVPGWPSNADGFWVATHAETKYAWWMRNNGVKDADIVINNVDGPCAGQYSCPMAVQAILPEGSKVRIWWPGRTTPMEVIGTGVLP
ncbi:MAG: hypothetical protein HOV79_30125, partial [Hamadaea sp.]|nr:hypothetical protein [Hamadaea sp.]